MNSIAKDNPENSTDIAGIKRMEIQITKSLENAMKQYCKRNPRPTGVDMPLRELAAIAIKEKMQRAGLVAKEDAV